MKKKHANSEDDQYAEGAKLKKKANRLEHEGAKSKQQKHR